MLETLPDPSGYAGASAIPVSDARDQGLIPKADTARLQAFSTSEMKLYKHTTTYKWTTDELVEIGGIKEAHSGFAVFRIRP